MSRAVEESNRRMLRARDAMDRDYEREHGVNPREIDELLRGIAGL